MEGNQLDTRALRALLARATPGPWRTDADGVLYADDDDVRAIVALVNAAPALLDRAERHDALVREALVSAGLHADGDAIQLVRDVAAALVETRAQLDAARRITADEARARHAAEATMDEALDMLDDGDGETLTAEQTARALVIAAETVLSERDEARAELARVETYIADASQDRDTARDALDKLRAAVEGARGALGWAWAQADAAAERGEDAAYATWRDRLRLLLAATKGGAAPCPPSPQPPKENPANWRPGNPPSPRLQALRDAGHGCHAHKDGECPRAQCPQTENESAHWQPSCPLIREESNR